MNHINSKISYSNYTSSDKNISFINIIKEMKALGIDPRPILEIAANDIFSLHGSQVLAYTETILIKMIEENDSDGIYLWNELHTILNNQILVSHMSIH